MRLLFDTMPLAGARFTLTDKQPDTLDSEMLSALRQHVTAYTPVERSLMKLDCQAVPDELVPDQTNMTPAELKQLAGVRSDARRTLPVWSFDASQSLTQVTNLDCRAESEEYRNLRVLESLEFGSEDPSGDFGPKVVVVTTGGRIHRLALDDDACIASMIVRNGSAGANCPSLWPVPASHEYGILHVFLYELDPRTNQVTAGQHIIDPELDVFHSEVEKLTEAGFVQGEEEGEYLDRVGDIFVDEAWQAVPLDAAVAAEVGAGETEASAKEVALVPHRVLVCVSLGLHKVGDDYTPYRPAWGVRAYPVVMVRSNHELAKVRAGVKLVRPAFTTIDGAINTPCACHEMNNEIDSMLFTDSNVGPPYDIVEDRPPIPLWNELFDYYVPKASQVLVGKRTKVVDASKGKARMVDGISKLGKPTSVWRLPRQGAFDNIHLAPTMRMPKVARLKARDASLLDMRQAVEVVDPDRESWRLNDIGMAPICAHDCFHMHWRWSNAFVSATDRTAMGFVYATDRTSPMIPYRRRGAPLVPPNQDLYIRLPDQRSLVYEAEAWNVKAEAWQVICHHGVGYVTLSGLMVEVGRMTQDLQAQDLPTHRGPPDVLMPTFYDPAGNVLTAKDNWPVWYWRNRYYVPMPAGTVEGNEPAEVAERVEITSLTTILHEP